MELVCRGGPPRKAGSYPYAELAAEKSEIRLLTLFPGAWDDEIICDIKNVSLDAEPEYEALSYTWGPPENPRSITLGGHNVPVRSSLEIALRYLRKEDVPRTLWIDALCINQGDVAERGAQVPRMYTIYNKARRVLAWLGEPGQDGDEGMELMAKFGQIVFDRFADGSFNIADMGFTWMLSSGLDYCSANWTALYNLWTRQYWSRIWVIQELASSLIASPMLFDKPIIQRADRCLFGCGRTWIESRLYTSLGLYLTSPGPAITESLFNVTWRREDNGVFGTPAQPPKPYPGALKMYKMLQRTCREYGSEECNALAKMLRETSTFGATDARDKVYGLLALCLEKDRIMPDYSISTVEMLKSLVSTHIASTQTLDILLGNRRQDRNGRPSWTPQLSGFEMQSTAWFHSNLVWAGRRSGETSDMEVEFDMPEGLLHVRGFAFGQIERVIGPFPASLIERRMLNAADPSKIDYKNPIKNMLGYLGELFAFARDLPPARRTHCWKALILDLHHVGLDMIGPTPDNFDELFAILIGVIPLEFAFPDMSPQVMQHLQPLYNQIEANLAERCFFTVTFDDDDFMAIGPYDTKPGDQVVVLFGGAQCFILRPCCCGVKYELIGDAYVYRLMDGHVCEDVLDGRFPRMRPRMFAIA